MPLHMTLTEAPSDVPLELAAVARRELADRLRRLGVDLGARFIRSGEGVNAPSVRVGLVNTEDNHLNEIVLGGEMAARVMVHLDDDRKLPLPELAPGDEGHVEGLVSDCICANALQQLGIVENDRIRLVRRLPPMRYVTMVNDGGRMARVALSDGQAAMIRGRFLPDGPEGQFALARVNTAFLVEKTLGAPQMLASLKNLGAVPGAQLTLVEVQPSQQVALAGHASIKLVTQDGLTLLVHPHDAVKMTVLVP